MKNFNGPWRSVAQERETFGNANLDPVLQEYERLTGFHETNINAIYHHVASLYGPPCSCCGKPLRTPEQGFAVHVCSLFRDLVSQLYQHSN